MSILEKGTLKKLWDLRNLSVNESIEVIAKHPNLQFLLTTAGLWFLVRWLIALWIGGHVLYFVYRIFNLVLV